MMSSADGVDRKGNTLGRTICPLSFAVIALIFAELRFRPPPPPPHGPTRFKKARSE